MIYRHLISGIFRTRPNRFIAFVDTQEGTQRCHVKNTGRCKELLVPGCEVYLDYAGDQPSRKTAYDLVAVRKGERLINMDAQAPNRVFREWAAAGHFLPGLERIVPEVRWGASRLDFCLYDAFGPYWVEVKGVTLEEQGHAYFPDAPTERGVRHLQELSALAEQGQRAAVFFVIQMEDVDSFAPNERTHPAFGAALRQAAAAGVQIFAYDCVVTPNQLELRQPVPILL